MRKWNFIQNQPLLRQIFKEPPIISYKKGKSLKDMLVRAKIQKVNTRFHAGIDVRPVTPCIFSWYVYRCSCRRDQKKIEVIPAWILKLPRLQQIRKLQNLENSISCRRATFGKFHILPARLENSRSCWQDLENSRSCGKI